MDKHTTLMLLAQLSALAVASLVCVPHLLLLLGLRRYRNGTYGGPAELVPEEKPEAYQNKYEQLLAHDFTPLGMHWSRIGRTIATQAYLFGSTHHRCLAQIYDRSHNLYLITAFEGGDVIYTMDTCAKARRLPGYCVMGIADANVEQLLAEHRRQVNAWVAEGRIPLPVATLPEAQAICHAVNTHPANQRLLTRAAASNLRFSLFILALGSALAGWKCGFAGPGPWLGILVAGAFLQWLWSGASTRVKLDRSLTRTADAAAAGESSTLSQS